MFERRVDMDPEASSDIIGRAGASLEHGQNVGLPDVFSGRHGHGCGVVVADDVHRHGEKSCQSMQLVAGEGRCHSLRRRTANRIQLNPCRIDVVHVGRDFFNLRLRACHAL